MLRRLAIDTLRRIGLCSRRFRGTTVRAARFGLRFLGATFFWPLNAASIFGKLGSTNRASGVCNRSKTTRPGVASVKQLVVAQPEQFSQALGAHAGEAGQVLAPAPFLPQS